MELADCFAPDLLETAQRRLAEAKSLMEGKRKRLHKNFNLVCEAVGMKYVDDLARKLRDIETGDDVSLCAIRAMRMMPTPLPSCLRRASG